MIIEDQAFSSSYDLAPPLPPLHSVSSIGDHTGGLKKRDNWLWERWEEGVGKEPNHTTARKPGPL
jgi:hypothetical protein